MLSFALFQVRFWFWFFVFCVFVFLSCFDSAIKLVME